MPRKRSPERYSTSPVPLAPGRLSLDDLEKIRASAAAGQCTEDPDQQLYDLRAAATLGLTVAGDAVELIAKKTGLTVDEVRFIQRALTKQGLLGDRVKDALKRFQDEAVPIAIESMLKKLEMGDGRFIERTLETVGVLATRTAPGAGGTLGGQSNAPTLPALTLNINLPPGVTAERASRPVPGEVVGRPMGSLPPGPRVNTIDVAAVPDDLAMVVPNGPVPTVQP